MNENRLRTLLREISVPDTEAARERGLRLLQQAQAERRSAPQTLLPRLAIAIAAAALLGAVLLSPAAAAVRGLIDDVFDAGVPNSEPALTEIPGGGRLLVQSGEGPWVVQADGSRRLLGNYREASWSPHGLFVATASGSALSAVEPGGTPHWSLSAKGAVTDPRWSPSGIRIAYRAGRELRVVAGDGSGDKLLDPRTRAVAPAWFPSGLPLLAYVTSAGRLQVVSGETGSKPLTSAPAQDGVRSVEWAPDGSTLLETTPNGAWLHAVAMGKLAPALALGPPRRIELQRGTAVQAAAFSPRRDAVAILAQRRGRTGLRSEVLLADTGHSPRRLFAVSGRLKDLAWSPDGSRLLVGWPGADQWLFIPIRGNRRIQAVGNISSAFAPGGGTANRFPSVAGWCCPADRDES
jgi:hypothetical protein